MATENFQAPGTTIRELRSGVPQIRGVPTSVGAMTGRCLRGPGNKAVRLDSLAKGMRIFGNFDPNSFLMEQLDGAFKNGASAIYLVRNIPTGGGGTNTNATFPVQTGLQAATAASKVLGSAPYNMTAGMAFSLDVDNVGAASATFDATAAIVTGSGATYAALNTLTVILEVDNGGSQTATMTAGATDDLTSAAELNTQLNGVSVDVSGGEIRFTSDSEGTGSEVDITGGTALAALGLTVAVTNGIGDVVDITAVTAAEFKTVVEADTTSTVALSGDIPTMSSPTTGVTSELDFISGTALTVLGLTVETIVGLASGAAVDAMTFTAVGPGSDYNSVKIACENEDTKIGIEGSALLVAVSAGAVTSVTLPAAMINSVSVGDTLNFLDSSTSNNIRAVISRIDDNVVQFVDTPTAASGGLVVGTTSCTLETWKFSAIEAGRIIAGPFRGLRMSSLSVSNYALTRVNVDDDEAVVTIADGGSSVGVNGSDNRPVNTTTGGDLLVSGSTMSTYQDVDFVGTSSNGFGLHALDKKRDVRLVAVPGVTGTVTGAVSKGLVDYCSEREDCVGLISPPAGSSVAAAVTYRNDNIGSTSYGIGHFPHLQILNPLSSQKTTTPPEGFIMGMIARTDRERGVAKAPAGDIVGRLVGALDVELELTDDERGQLYAANINPIEDIEGAGIAAMGSRTLESGEFNQINVRRTFIFLKESIKIGTRFVLFEPNDPATRAKVRRVVFAFLKTEWERGNLEGETVDEAFFVTCDKSNNPENSINEGKMRISIGVNIPRTTEFLIIDIQQDQRGVEAALGF